MRLSDDQTDSTSLSVLGSEVVGLIKSARFEELASRFGYALAYDQEPSAVIEREIAQCTTGEGREATISTASPRITVKYFKPSESFFFALVECFMPLMHDSGEILVELIVGKKGDEKNVYLEQISYAAQLFRKRLPVNSGRMRLLP